ncbi:MAG: multiheme c-type cytochrome [Nitrospinales bacterium]
MRKFCFSVLAAIVLWWGLASATKTADLLILYTGNTFGELKPCGCAKEEDQGGIERRAAYFKEVRSGTRNVLLLDSGDSFKEPTVQGKIKARYLMRSMARMNYDAVVPGDKDFVYGTRFLGELKGIPWVAANLVSPAPVLPPYQIKRFENGLAVAIVGLVAPELFYAGPHTDIHVRAPRETLENLLPGLRQKEHPDLVILLTHMPRQRALDFLDVAGVDVVINGHIEKATDLIDMTPVRRAERIFAQAGPRGQKVGELRVTLDAAGKKHFQQRMVKLDSHVKFDPEMVKLYGEYNEKIEEIFFAALAAKKNKGREKNYATETVCKQCHAEAHDIWSRSRHAGAYATLQKVNKAFDPECLVCHTVGFGRPGGFLSETDTPELENVQCEVCHGPGLAHSRAPRRGWSQPARQACKRCHVKNHSPRFDYADYWPRIKH